MKTVLRPSKGWTLLAIVFVLAVWGAWPKVILGVLPWLGFPVVPDEAGSLLPSLGQSGDLYGGLNALLTGGALVAVALTFLKEREALRVAKSDSEQMQQAADLERFESGFLAVLQVVRDTALTARSLDEENRRTENGHGAFEQERTLLMNSVIGPIRMGRVMPSVLRKAAKQGESAETIQPLLDDFFRKRESTGPMVFLRTAAHAIEWLAAQGGNPRMMTARAHYAGLLSAQLSEAQLFLLYYFALSTEGTSLRDSIAAVCLFRHAKGYLRSQCPLSEPPYHAAAFDQEGC